MNDNHDTASKPASPAQRRRFLKAAGAAGVGVAGFPFVHAQEKVTLRYLGTAVNQDKKIADKFEADTGIKPPFALEAFGDLERDVRQSMARIKASPFVPNKDNIRGFIYEVEKGTLREVT